MGLLTTCGVYVCLALACILTQAHAAPRFAGGVTAINVLVLEDAEIGTVFGSLSVVDADDPTYTVPGSDVMLSGSPTFFNITVEGTSVLLTVVASLSGQANVYDVTVTLISQGLSVAVNIQVRQVNFAPVFYSSHYFATIMEDLEVGDVVIADIEAIDFDLGTNGHIEYAFANPGLVSPPLAIDSETAIVTLTQNIDYDSGDTSFKFNVTARETLSVAMLTATASVQITVLNVNDHPPLFQGPPIYKYSIMENSGAALQTTSDGLTTTITATDGDVELYGQITYELTGGQSLFTIEETSSGAQLRTTASLDREAAQTYTMTLIAQDGGSPPLADSVEIEVEVLDENDVDPVFSVNEYRISLFEGMEYQNFVTFHATDGDEEMPNNQVTYTSIVRDGGGSNPFTLNPATGTVSVNGLDYETDQNFTLIITAEDGGTPSNTAEATLSVTVLPTNEDDPAFVEEVYSASVSESLDVNGEIGVTVLATDPEGHTVEYSIDQSFQDGDFFNIDTNDGVITLARSLDRDPPSGHDVFTFEVVATDVPSGGEARRSGQAQVVVTVSDVNDNAPVITSPDQSHITLEVEEEKAVLATVLFTIMATDIDGDSDGDNIVYMLAANDDSLLYFSLNRDSGVFQQSAQVDREACNPVPCHYEMTASACDEGATPMCSSLSVTVTVLDTNDNPPMIINSVLTGSADVLECQVDGRVLSTVTAVDNSDTGDFAEVAYETVTGDVNHIILNEGTGVLTLGSEAVDYETGDRSFSLTVRAIDNPDGPASDRLTSANIFVQTIMIGDCNDEPPVFTDSLYIFSVSENSPAGDITGPTIDSTDADATNDNKNVMYRATNLGADSWFDIYADGRVYIRDGATVDREDSSILTDNEGNGVVTFTIQAVNSAPTGVLTSTQNAQVLIRISDENDNAPVMDATPLTGSETITLLESTPAGSGTIVSVVRATDSDVGDNAHIQYQITSGNDLGKFALNGNTGVVTLLEEIDSESDPLQYTLTITAVNDLAASPPPPSDQDHIVLTIRVEATNEHAPKFEQDRYDKKISEYNALAATQQHAEGDVIVTVLALDNDTDTNNHNEIRYTITGGNEEDIFDIPNPEVGNIVLRKPELVDYEKKTFYALLITATDLVIPEIERKTDSTYVNITVMDENDNVPELSSVMYTGFVNEEQDAQTTVILMSPITATDRDSLKGTESMQFAITTTGTPQPDPFLAFTLSADGTSLKTTLPIDREESGNVFTFQITVTDTAGNKDDAIVTIAIIDINDKPPVIQETPQALFITIPENHPVDSTIATITAVDEDLDTNADFTFAMQGGAGYFEINLNTGVVKLVSSLQALEPPRMFPLTVYAIDTGGLNTSVTFMANLTFSNDHPPIFQPSIYFGSVLECADDGTDITPVITVSATDADSNSMVRYYINSSSVGALFQMDDRGGVADILTNGEGVYDRETADTLVFTVFATDGIVGTDDDVATVTITLTDCNDNHPIFTQDLYDIDVHEGTVQGTTVIQVHTNDADINENAEVRYRIDSVDPPSLSGVFTVDEVSGGIVASTDITNDYTGTSGCSQLAVQPSNNITLRIEATDQATQQTRLSNYTTVFIRLLDRNSEAPSFIPSSFYSFSISENIEDVIVGMVEATDECDLNSVVTYVLVDGEDSAPFAIISSSGMIHLLSSLDRETNDLLVFQVLAVDDGTDPGPQTGHASISIEVLDENDNAPVLVEDTFELSRPENIPVGTTLVTLLATDPDLQENGTLSYRILSGDTELFQLESPGGSNSDHLVTVTSLDRETVSSHIVTVLVEDGGTPRKNDTAIISLTLTDVNDNEPTWIAGHGTFFNIQENASSMVIVDLDAVDIDEGINSELVYFFVGGSQDSGPFHIDRGNGTLYLVGELDYETTNSYILNIAVADRNGSDNGVDTVLQTTTTVTVSVTDINDNLPYFNRCPHHYEILETLAKGSVVGTGIHTSVADQDTVKNPFYFYIVSEEDVKCTQTFCINDTTGEIKLNDDIDYEKTPMYVFYVVVSDRPNLTPSEAYSSPTIDLCNTVATQKNNITKVEVSLVDVNDHAPEFVPDSLLAAVAEEAEFGTTVTELQATDIDSNGTFSTVYFEIIELNAPFLVDRETGEVTTADVFTGRSGDIEKITVVAYDNEGRDPSLSARAVLTVRVFKESQQIIAVVDQPKEDTGPCLSLIEDAISNRTGHNIYITKVRVQQDKQLELVDTTKSDLIFYALDLTTGDVVEPQVIIDVIEEALDLQQEPINTVFRDCKIIEVKTFFSTQSAPATSQSVSLVVGIVIGALAAMILALLICLLCVCALERRKARKLRVRKKQSFEQSSNFSQFSQVATANPIWMPPYEQWEEESTTTANQSTVMDRENPVYESQELIVEMYHDDEDALSSASSHTRMKPPRSSSTPAAGAYDSVYDDYDPLADALGISEKPDDSQTSLI